MTAPERRKISALSREYDARRRSQVLRFFTATAFTLVSFKLFKKGLSNRLYHPTMFQLNNMPPPVAAQNEAMSAFVIATAITGSVFSMAIFGSFWIYDISNVHELKYRLKNWFGTDNQGGVTDEVDTMDQETSQAIEQLKSVLNRD